MLGSRVEATLTRRRATRSTLSPSLPEAPLDAVDLIVADLDTRRARRRWSVIGMPVLGYYSHVDVETRKRGRRRRVSTGRAALADGARTAARRLLAGRAGYSDQPSVRSSRPGSRLSRKAASTSSGRSSRPCSRSQAAHSRRTAGRTGAGQVGEQDVELGRLVGAVEARVGGQQVAERLDRVLVGEAHSRGGSRRPSRRPGRGRSSSVVARRRSGPARGRAGRRSGRP